MNPPQSGTSLTGDAVQTIGGRNTRGDKSDSPGRRNEIFTSTHTCGRSVPSGAGRGYPRRLWVRLPSSTARKAGQEARPTRYRIYRLTSRPSRAFPVLFYGVTVDYRETLVVALSQSGESTDTNLVLERAREQGALTLGITNERRSTLAG